MSDSPEYDVIINGAGPSGSLYAYLLAKSGLRVLVLEKLPFPRPKVCGGYLSPRAWSIWRRTGLIRSFETIPHTRPASLRLCQYRGPSVHYKLPTSGDGPLVLDRASFDQWLAEQAQAQGAEYRFSCPPKSFSPEEGISIGIETFKARLYVGADGRASWLGHASGLLGRVPPKQRTAWQANIKAPEGMEREVRIIFFDEGYLIGTPASNGECHIQIALARGITQQPHEILKRFFPDSRPGAWRSCNGVGRLQATPCRPGVLLLGDAARSLEPICMDGISMALATAETAALLTIQHLSQNPARICDLYPPAWKNLYRHLRFFNPLATFLANRPQAAQWAFLQLSKNPSALSPLVQDVLPVGDSE